MANTDLQNRIKGLNDRELQEDIAYFSNESEKHLRGIKSILSWFFWIFIICLAIWAIVSFLTYDSTPSYRRY